MVRRKQEDYWHSSKDYMRFTLISTLRCNANCSYCYENSIERQPMSADVIEQTLVYIKRKCEKCKMLSVYWFDGEPLVEASKIDYISKELLDFCTENGISYRTSIATNVSLILDDDYINKMIPKW